MDNDLPLRPSAFATLLGVSERRARQLAGTLETLGFTLEVGANGSRLVPQVIANAVFKTRAAGRDLRVLRDDPDLLSLLRPGQPKELDPLDILVEQGAEVTILREAYGTLLEALRGGVRRSAFVLPTDWRHLGLPDPKARL